MCLCRKPSAKLNGARLADDPASSGAPPSLHLSQIGSQVHTLFDGINTTVATGSKGAVFNIHATDSLCVCVTYLLTKGMQADFRTCTITWHRAAPAAQRHRVRQQPALGRAGWASASAAEMRDWKLGCGISTGFHPPCDSSQHIFTMRAAEPTACAAMLTPAPVAVVPLAWNYLVRWDVPNGVAKEVHSGSTAVTEAGKHTPFVLQATCALGHGWASGERL